MKAPQKSLWPLVFELWRRISPVRRRQFLLLLALMLAASFAEVVSIASILPFLGLLTAPERIFLNPMVQPLATLFGIHSAQELILPVTMAFCLAAVLVGMVRILLLHSTTRYSFGVGADISIAIYRRTLYQPYSVHIARNSSEVINAISTKTGLIISGVIQPLLMLLSSIILLAGILFALLALDPVLTLIAGGLFGTIYALIVKLSKNHLKQNSECIARESTQVIKSLQEGLGGIRDVLIDGTQEFYCQIYQAADRPLRTAQGQTIFISASPRYLVETLGMILVALLAYTMSQRSGGVAAAIPMLGALALGAQRLLPILQQGYGSLTIIGGAEASLRDTLALLNQPLPEYVTKGLTEPIPFEREICIVDLSFRYSPETPWVFQKVNLTIPKGRMIGFMGATGSGKSTMIDLIMGLLQPTEGFLKIDGRTIDESNYRRWQAHIAHVPQAIYLADSAIDENIAFGIPRDKIDFERVRMAARGAQIADVIESWPARYRTFVGERGIRLSGGQRQRIGIARALYKQADVIIFDEATSALDYETESAVMETIHRLGRGMTVLIIAHRLTTLKDCDLIVELGRDGNNRIGRYKDLVEIDKPHHA